MATPVPPDVRIRLYQLEINGGATNLQKKAGTSYQYTTGSAANDFHLISLGQLSESLEIDKGVYMMDSIPVTVDGLSPTLFSTYDDPLNEPWVCEIYDTANTTVVFHGPIERQSIQYNARTGQHSFDVLSWTYVLEQTAAACRTVYETRLAADMVQSSGTTGITVIKIPRFADDGQDMSGGEIVAGDVAVIETAYGEWRSAITGVTTNANDLALFIVGEPQALALSGYTAAGAACSRRIYTIAASTSAEVLQVQVSNAALWAALNNIRNDINSDPEIRFNSFIDVAVEYFTSGNQASIRCYPNGTMNYTYSVTGQVGMNPRSWALSSDETTVTLTWDAPAAYVSDADTNGLYIDAITIPTEMRKGTKVRILGKDVYGYAPSGLTATLQMYSATEILEGLFGLSALGIFRFVTTVFTYPTGFSNVTVPRYLEWPENLMEALRLYQNTFLSFLKFTPTLDGSSLPRLTVEVIKREEANTTDRTTTAISGIIEYTEQSADLTPRAVAVLPSIKYNIPSGLKRYETRGFYYPTVGTDNPKTTVAPIGSDVVEFKVNVTPDWTLGDLWVSNDAGVWNPDNFQQLAKFFYTYYAECSQPCSLLVNGFVSRDVLGNFITINEGGLARTIFVTGRNFDALTRDTELTGLVGEFTTAITGNPVAYADGGLVYFDVDGGGTEVVRLSGQRSYSPIGLPLTFTWTLDPLGVPSTIGSDAILEWTGSVGTHTIRLTVSDGTNTDTADVTIYIQNNAGAGTGFATVNASFSSGPTLSIRPNGDVYCSTAGDANTTQATSGVEIEYSLTSAAGPWSAVGTYNNPVNEQLVYATLAEDVTIWVQITLKNRTDGTDGGVWIGSISNTLGSTIDTITIETLLDLNGSFDMDGGALDTASVNIGGQEFMLIDASGILFDLAAGDTFDVNNAAGNAFQISDAGTDFSVLAGDHFTVNVIGLDTLVISELGVIWDIATGDVYTWDVNSILKMTLDATDLTLDNVDLDMNSNDIKNAASYNGMNPAGGLGVNFGPAAPASITVVNGIVTAIS